MAEQLHGVLREVVVLNEGTSHPVVSNLFGGDLQPLHADSDTLGPDWRHLPSVRLNAADPAATLVLNAMILDPERQVSVLKEAIDLGQAQATGEAGLGLGRALIEVGDYAGAEACLAQVESVSGRDWRVTWYRAISLLVQGRAAEAQRLFDYLHSELSGELAPKLALASAAELAGDLDTAGRLYEVVAATDTSFTSACFGLARVRRTQGDRASAVDAYQLIPRTSRLYTLAQLSMARTLNEPDGDRPPSVDDLARASAAIERLSLDPVQRAQLTVEILGSALELFEKRLAPPSDAMLLGTPFQEEPVRMVLEQAYRDLARLANGDEKIWLVDQANRVRPPIDDFTPRTLNLEIRVRIRRGLSETSIMRLAEDLSDQTYRPISPIIFIGRQDCDITLPDPALSRRHAEIVKIGDKWAIRDLGSTNGTKVNGKALATGVWCYVGPGDLIELGSFFDLSVRPER